MTAASDRQAVEGGQDALPGIPIIGSDRAGGYILEEDADHGVGVVVAASRRGWQERHAVWLSAVPSPDRGDFSRYRLGICVREFVAALRLAAQYGRRGAAPVQVADHGVGWNAAGRTRTPSRTAAPGARGNRQCGVFGDGDADSVDGWAVDADVAASPVGHLHALRLEPAHGAVDLFARCGQPFEDPGRFPLCGAGFTFAGFE